MRREKIDVMKLVAVLSISAAGLALLTFLMSRQTDEVFASSKARTDAVALFDSKCAMCHGKDGRGTKFGKAKGAPDFTNSEWQKSHADEQIKSAVTNGRGKSMPAWKDKLSPEEIISLVGRVREFAMKQ